MPSELDVLSYTVMTETVQNFKFGQFILQNNLFPSRDINGTVAEWDILKPSRQKGTFSAPGAPARRVAMESVGHKTARCAHYFEKVAIDAYHLNNLRKPGTLEEKASAAFIAKQQKLLSRRNQNNLEWAIASAMSGSLSVNQDDVKFTVNYGIQSSHKPNASASWATSTTDIMGDILNWQKLIRKDSGYAAGRVFTSTTTLKYLQANTNVKDLMGDGRIKEEFFETGMLKNFMNMEWYFYDAGYVSGGSFSQFITEDKLIMVPMENDWGDLQHGSELIPSDDGQDLVEVQGEFSYAVVQKDPPGIDIYVGDNWLPVITIPDAIVYAELTP